MRSVVVRNFGPALLIPTAPELGWPPVEIPNGLASLPARLYVKLRDLAPPAWADALASGRLEVVEEHHTIDIPDEPQADDLAAEEPTETETPISKRRGRRGRGE